MAVQQSLVTIESRWGKPATHVMHSHPHASRLVVIFPGSNYPVDAPLLRFARIAALEQGFDALSLEYGFQTNRSDIQSEDISTISEEANRAIDAVSQSYETLIFISKSLGTVVAGRVQQQRPVGAEIHHHIFLTPLPATVESMRNTPHAMVIVGTRDPLFDAEQIARVSQLSHVELRTIQGANHALEVDGYRASLNALGDATDWCAQFLQDIR